jgi:hypothetical protein
MIVANAPQPQQAAPAVTNGGSPFIGARPFLAPPLAAQFFCARRGDVQELCALLHSHRAVILHGGAGRRQKLATPCRAPAGTGRRRLPGAGIAGWLAR